MELFANLVTNAPNNSIAVFGGVYLNNFWAENSRLLTTFGHKFREVHFTKKFPRSRPMVEFTTSRLLKILVKKRQIRKSLQTTRSDFGASQLTFHCCVHLRKCNRRPRTSLLGSSFGNSADLSKPSLRFGIFWRRLHESS